MPATCQSRNGRVRTISRGAPSRVEEQAVLPERRGGTSTVPETSIAPGSRRAIVTTARFANGIRKRQIRRFSDATVKGSEE